MGTILEGQGSSYYIIIMENNNNEKLNGIYNDGFNKSYKSPRKNFWNYNGFYSLNYLFKKKCWISLLRHKTVKFVF